MHDHPPGAATKWRPLLLAFAAGAVLLFVYTRHGGGAASEKIVDAEAEAKAGPPPMKPATRMVLESLTKRLDSHRDELRDGFDTALKSVEQRISTQQLKLEERLTDLAARQDLLSAEVKTVANSVATAAAAAGVATRAAVKSKVNRNSGHWVVETSERVREKFGEMPPLPSGPTDRECAGHSTCFFGRCFCEPGWTGSDCLTPLIPYNQWYTDCPTIDPKHKGNTPCPPNTIYYHHDKDCPFLCGYHPDSGVPRTDLKLWKAAQLAEAGVWSGGGEGNDRADEHRQGFADFKTLQNNNFFFGDMIEFGCGPWTQTAMMLQHLGNPSSVNTITLLEPNGARYLKEVPGSSYRTGQLNGRFPVVLVSVGGEGFDDGWRFVEHFDTVVSLNVIEHVHDAFRYFMNLWLALKPGGTIIFHDRWFDDPIKANGVLGTFALHPIRVNRVMMDHFVNQFEPLYKSTEMTDRMKRARMHLSKGEDPAQTITIPINEQSYYFIGRKPLNATTDFCKLKP